MTSPGPYAAEFLRRVRAWPVSSWRHGQRQDIAFSTLNALAQLASVADGRRRPAVPGAGLHALPDQLHVLIDDAFTAGADPGQVEAVLRGAAGELGLRIG